MKKTARILTLSAVALFFAATASRAQIVVRVRPARPAHVVVVRPYRPSPRHVWVEEEWTPNGGTYVYHPGYWAEPPRHRAIWVRGYWRHTRGGEIWIPGRWR